MDLEQLKEQVIEKIRTVFDPEIPLNVYDLGLIYDVQVTEMKEVVVLMTLTAPNCPAAGYLPSQVEEAAKSVEGVTDCKTILTFDPPWDKSRLSEDAQLMLEMI